ncbi:MAG TPA: cytochrome ubiquinol oxidase subunit I [Actinomycetota bacterium]|nr:cytochrome ubiquinol oxidase subunit I [Actinomycetota bacterium]
MGLPAPVAADEVVLRAAVVAGPAAVVTLEVGWIVTEVGRQPWIVYNLMKVEDAATANMSDLPKIQAHPFGTTGARHSAATAATVAAHTDEITAHFYPRMFAAHPELLRVFNQGNQATGEQSKAPAGSAAAYAVQPIDPEGPHSTTSAANRR